MIDMLSVKQEKQHHSMSAYTAEDVVRDVVSPSRPTFFVVQVQENAPTAMGLHVIQERHRGQLLLQSGILGVIRPEDHAEIFTTDNNGRQRVRV